MKQQKNPSTTMTKHADQPSNAQAWWRFPMVWLVVGGPAIVVVASFITLALAILNPDPVLDTHVPSADDLDHKAVSMAPAMQGRNQAAAVALHPVPSSAGNKSRE